MIIPLICTSLVNLPPLGARLKLTLILIFLHKLKYFEVNEENNMFSDLSLITSLWSIFYSYTNMLGRNSEALNISRVFLLAGKCQAMTHPQSAWLQKPMVLITQIWSEARSCNSFCSPNAVLFGGLRKGQCYCLKLFFSFLLFHALERWIAR